VRWGRGVGGRPVCVAQRAGGLPFFGKVLRFS
jgi:hypothetical protein